jgi:DNA polymerase (family 10)
MLATELKQEFDRLADTLDILGESQFRSRAYRRAALFVMEMTEHDLHSFSQKELEDMPGIGEGIAKKIIEYRETGHMKAAEKEEQKIPPGLFELLTIPNLGPKSIRKMWKGLGIKNRTDLEKAITEKNTGAARRIWREKSTKDCRCPRYPKKECRSDSVRKSHTNRRTAP